MRATVSALVIPPLLTLVSFARVARFLSHDSYQPTSNTNSVVTEVDADALAEWVSRVLYRLRGPWRHTCLKRATVLFHLLGTAGYQIELVIGVKHDDDGAVAAHAWLERDGIPFLENDPSHPSRYKEIARFPERT